MRNVSVCYVDFKDSDHNLECPALRLRHWISPYRRKRGSDDSGRRATIDLERLKMEYILRCEFQHWVQHKVYCSPATTLPGLTVGTMTKTLKDTVLSAAEVTAPRTMCKRGPKGWCTREKGMRQIQEAGGKREASRRQPRGANGQRSLKGTEDDGGRAQPTERHGRV